MWVELKSYQFRCMQGYFPKDVSSGKKRNGEAALFISVVFEFSGADMGWMSVPGWVGGCSVNLLPHLPAPVLRASYL